MGDPVENDFPRCRLCPLNRVRLRVPIQEDIQLRHFGDPTAIDLAIKLDSELHDQSYHPGRGAVPGNWRATVVVDQKTSGRG